MLREDVLMCLADDEVRSAGINHQIDIVILVWLLFIQARTNRRVIAVRELHQQTSVVKYMQLDIVLSQYQNYDFDTIPA